MAALTDELHRALLWFTSAKVTGWLDFSSSAAAKSITLTAGKTYQAILDGTGTVFIRYDGSTAAFPTDTNTAIGQVVSAGHSPVFSLGASQTTVSAIAKAAGCSVYFVEVE